MFPTGADVEYESLVSMAAALVNHFCGTSDRDVRPETIEKPQAPR